MITWDNYEEYIMMQVDGELSPAEQQELTSFLEQHPALKAEQAAYALTKVFADDSIVYADKESLVKRVPAKRIIAFPHWQRYSIAAGVAALICISALRFMNRSDNAISIVALADTAKITDTHLQTSIAAVPDTFNTVAPVQVPVNGQTDIHAVKNAVAVKNTMPHHVPVQASYTGNKNNNIAEPEMIVQGRPEPINMDAITLPDLKKMPVTTATTAPELLTIPTNEPVAVADKHKSFIDRLPLDEANKKQVAAIAGAVAGAYEQVSDAKESLEGNKVRIRVHNTGISINF